MTRRELYDLLRKELTDSYKKLNNEFNELMKEQPLDYNRLNMITGRMIEITTIDGLLIDHWSDFHEND